MADLSEVQASQAVKIAGASTSGTETNFVGEYNNQLQSADIINTTALQANLVVSTTAVECKVGGSNLANRKLIVIQAQNAGYSYGFASGLQPFALPNGATITISLGPNISIWVRKSSGSGTVSVAEVS